MQREGLSRTRRGSWALEANIRLASPATRNPGSRPMRSWAFITSHARVLLAIAQNPELRVDQIAREAGVTERSVYRVIADLVEAGYLRRTRIGTRNLYELDAERPLGDPVVGDRRARDLLSLVGRARSRPARTG
jgi:DNA-binding transcriptional ArsR family regulator